MRLCRRAPLSVLPLLAAVLLAGCGGTFSSYSVQSSPPATPASVGRTASPAPPATPTARATPQTNASATPLVTARATPRVTASATPRATASATPPVTASATPPVTASATPPVTASATPRATASATPRATASGTPRPTASPPPEALPVASGAGALPQTTAFPSTRSVAFRNAMVDLWLAVMAGNSRFALPAFFPEAAYEQVKAIPNPAADWQDRLWYDFALDVRAAHGLLARDARLVQVIVPAAEAAWIYPGACYNSVGYWHVGGARVVYLEHGQERSFGIASLISWRGVWYVVHFGEVLRPVVTGVVDQPAVGPGVPGPPGGC
jgi:hypothetical protein